jgi:hypothetical protein
MTRVTKKLGLPSFAGIVRRIDVVEAEGTSSSNLVWGFKSQALVFRAFHFFSSSSQFLCSIWEPVSSSRPAIRGRCRAQGLSRLAVAPPSPCTLPLPGHALTVPSSMAHSIWPGDDYEGSPLQDAITSRRNLVFGGPKDPDHDALMRISGEAPRRRAHSAQRHESLGFGGSPPPRIVIGDPSRSSGSSRVCTS